MCVVQEIAHQELPYGNTPSDVIVREVRKGTRLQFAPQVSAQLVELIRGCWHQDPAQRPAMLQVISILDELKAR